LLACNSEYCNFINAKPAFYPYQAKEDLDNLDQYISRIADATVKLLILINPHNPTGFTLNHEQFERILNVVVEKNIFLLCDEVYDNYLPINYNVGNLRYQHFSYKNVLLIGSTSKRYCTPGLRVGYIYGNKEVTRSISKFNLLISGGVSPICQATAAFAYDSDENIAPGYRELLEKRRQFTEIAMKNKGFVLNEDCGSIYVFFKIPGFTPENTMEFCRLALSHGVSVTPGIFFGKNSKDWIRLSLSAPLDQLQKAVSILNAVRKKMI